MFLKLLEGLACSKRACWNGQKTQRNYSLTRADDSTRAILPSLYTLFSVYLPGRHAAGALTIAGAHLQSAKHRRQAHACWV
jgi:hypothetical protein